MLKLGALFNCSLKPCNEDQRIRERKAVRAGMQGIERHFCIALRKMQLKPPVMKPFKHHGRIADSGGDFDLKRKRDAGWSVFMDHQNDVLAIWQHNPVTHLRVLPIRC